MAYAEIRYKVGTCYGADVVILVHPWKGRWSVLFAEDMYGVSPIVIQRLGVADAKIAARALRSYLLENFRSGGSVEYLDINEASRVCQEAVSAYWQTKLPKEDPEVAVYSSHDEVLQEETPLIREIDIFAMWADRASNSGSVVEPNPKG